MLRSAKDAEAPVAGRVTVPERLPPAGFVPRAIVILPVTEVAMLSYASRPITWTAGVIGAPAAVAVGPAVNTRRVAGPPVTATPTRAVIATLLMVAEMVFCSATVELKAVVKTPLAFVVPL